MRRNGMPRFTLGAGALILLGLMILSISVTAQENTVFRVKENRVSFHSIDVLLNADGSASVEERLSFAFFAGEAEQFVKDFAENNPSLAEWEADYPFIRPHIGLEARASNVEFLLDRSENGDPSLTVSYQYPAGLVQPLRESNQGRSTRWRLADNALVSFIEGGNIVIPANTQVRIHAPSGAIVDTSLLPQGVSAGNNIIPLTNFQSNSLEIQYTLLSPIADPIDAGKIFSDFTKSPLFALILGILILMGAYGIVNREKVSEGIENYLIEHSEFRPSPKQDIDADLEAENA